MSMLIQPARFGGGGGGGGGGDPDFASVTLLLHMDGTNGSTTFTDSTGGAALTVAGNTQISTAKSKFGGASALFDGTGDNLNKNTADARFQFPGNFTVEFWYNATSSATTNNLFDQRSSAGSGFGFGIFRSGTSIYLVTTSSNVIFGVGGSANDVWNHVAATRSGTAWRLFLNGVQIGSTYTSSANLSDGRCVIGANIGNTNTFNGHIDEVRITKGVARYTANFTPPTAAFPDA